MKTIPVRRFLARWRSDRWIDVNPARTLAPCMFRHQKGRTFPQQSAEHRSHVKDWFLRYWMPRSSIACIAYRFGQPDRRSVSWYQCQPTGGFVSIVTLRNTMVTRLTSKSYAYYQSCVINDDPLGAVKYNLF